MKKMSIPWWVVTILFTIKVAAGVYYGWFFSKMENYQQNADTWRMYFGSLEETQWIKTDLKGFIADLFSPRYKEDSNVLATSNSYWNDIKSVLVIKVMAVLNLLSGSRYYINVLFFEYISFLGSTALCRLFIKYFSQHKWLIIIVAFLFPSTLLWCSGFHKEGLLLTTLAVATWLTDQLITDKKVNFGKVLLLLFNLFISFLLRNSLTAFFVLWSIPWWLSVDFPAYRWKWFAATAAGFCAVFFASTYLPFLPNLPQYLAQRQQEFLELSGESLLPSTLLQPTFNGYVAALPSAVLNGFIQPLSTQAKKLSYLPAAAEVFFFLILVVYIFFKKAIRKQEYSVNMDTNEKAMLWFCVFFAAANFLLTGYTIPFLGAIVRYKSIVWPFISLPFITHLPVKWCVLEKNK